MRILVALLTVQESRVIIAGPGNILIVLSERLFEVFFRQFILAGALVDQAKSLVDLRIIGIDILGQLQIALGSFPVALTNVLPGQGYPLFQGFLRRGVLREETRGGRYTTTQQTWITAAANNSETCLFMTVCSLNNIATPL